MSMLSPEQVASLNQEFESWSTDAILHWAWKELGPRAGIGTSFQGAGLVMMHIASQQQLGFPIFTIDTGLLFPETEDLHRKLEAFLGREIERLTPELSLEQQAQSVGPELWKHNPDLCCTLRKVVPLQARLTTLDCWITGLRRQQSDTRATTGILELYVADPASGRSLLKMNPMANWSRDAVWVYLRQHGIPYNPLHDRGYRSIGCQPCTHLSADSADERAGRWTGFQKTECGIHTFMKKQNHSKDS